MVDQHVARIPAVPDLHVAGLGGDDQPSATIPIGPRHVRQLDPLPVALYAVGRAAALDPVRRAGPPPCDGQHQQAAPGRPPLDKHDVAAFVPDVVRSPRHAVRVLPPCNHAPGASTPVASTKRHTNHQRPAPFRKTIATSATVAGSTYNRGGGGFTLDTTLPERVLRGGDAGEKESAGARS